MDLINVLRLNRQAIGRVLSIDYRRLPFFVFDFTRNNQELEKVNMSNTAEFSRYVKSKISENNAQFGIGRYDENRTIYDHSDLFDGEIRRTIHLGIDLWVEPGTEVLCPIKARVHSFRNNNAGNGDYGPTIILEHELNGVRFYTLYGHLSLDSLENLEAGQEFNMGDVIGRVGSYPTNGDWPPHLHFQLVTNMRGEMGHFRGVASIENRGEYLELCPNPNLILQINGL